jgi:hypothetical protein
MKRTKDLRLFIRLMFATGIFKKSFVRSRKSASFCYTWVIPLHFSLTTNCGWHTILFTAFEPFGDCGFPFSPRF